MGENTEKNRTGRYENTEYLGDLAGKGEYIDKNKAGRREEY